jgi:hypothetical protein
MRRAFVVWLAVILSAAGAASARDAFVMISGGNSPFDNNYSQYLQARAVAGYFEQTYPRNSVWVFFGVGNVEGEQPFLSDVYRQVKRDGLMLDTWLPGSLPRNRPARRDVILRVFREEILPAVADGGTLYLFVGDHGSQTRGRNPESIITLWSMYPDAGSEHGWNHSADESLGVTELRGLLAGGLGKGRVVFCMTQCHAGGFHYLAMTHEMTPNTRWFTSTPDWAKSEVKPILLRAAGFTATDELSLASGCDPSPDPEQWAGYERFIPENLLGENLFTLERTGAGLHSFAEAHVAATLVDITVDKPYSTSEQYLERWATLIERRLVGEPKLASRVKKSVAAYQRTVDGATPTVSDKAFQERQAQFRAFTEKLVAQNGAVRGLLLTGTRSELEEAVNPPRIQASGRGPGRGTGAAQRQGRRGGNTGERRRLWNDTVEPAWKEAVAAGEAANLPAAAVKFEEYLLAQEADGRSFFLTGGQTLGEEAYWQAGYGNPQTLNPARAETITRWAMERRGKIIAWAKASEDGDVQTAGNRLAQLTPAPRTPANGAATLPERTVSKETAAERTLFYRRALAAWEFLLSVNERPALARLRELTELEHTPLPKPAPLQR